MSYTYWEFILLWSRVVWGFESWIVWFVFSFFFKWFVRSARHIGSHLWKTLPHHPPTISTSQGGPLPKNLFCCESSHPRPSFPLGQSRMELLSLSWNQNYECFAVGTSHGFQIYNCNPFKKISGRNLRSGGFVIVEMLFRWNVLALVGRGDNAQYPPNRVVIWDDCRRRCIYKFSFKHEVRAVKLTRDCIVMVLERWVYVYNFTNLRLLCKLQTEANPRGICCLSHHSNTSVLACPGLCLGEVRIEHIDSKMTKLFKAYDSDIACFAMTLDGRILATASTNGTLFRIFNTMDGTCLQEVSSAFNGFLHGNVNYQYSLSAKWLIQYLHQYCQNLKSSENWKFSQSPLEWTKLYRTTIK